MTFQTAVSSHLWLDDAIAVGEGTIDGGGAHDRLDVPFGT